MTMTLPGIINRKLLPAAGISLASMAVIGAALVMKDWLQKIPPPAPRIQMVSLLPPPPKIEKPPEPEVQQETRIQEVMQQPQEAPPAGSDLGVDADGNGSDNFNLKARKGGRGLLDGGPFGWYAARLDSTIQDYISGDKKLRRHGRYTALLRLWIAKDGRIQRVEIARTTGNRDLDAALRNSLAHMERVSDPPPDEMPQPVQLQITSRL